MRKCYIEENGVRYEEVDGQNGFQSHEVFPKDTLRVIEGKLYYLYEAIPQIRDGSGRGISLQRCTTRYDVHHLKRDKVIGKVYIPDVETRFRHDCYWKPVTKDMLHDVLQEPEGEDEQGNG